MSTSATSKVDTNRRLEHMSSGVAARYYMQHPEKAPEDVRQGYEKIRDLLAKQTQSATSSAASGPGALVRFNRDGVGLPQNEESVDVCRTNSRIVLGGTNDYRGLLDPQENFTGWHFSTNGGAALTNEGLLPPVRIFGKDVPSGGDPVDRIGEGCRLYAASLNYDPVDPFHEANGIGVYRSDAATLSSCPTGGGHASCWPTRRDVAATRPGHFFDKEWMDVGRSGSAGEVVWVSWTDFRINDEAPLGFTSAKIRATRCSSNLTGCTEPILISGRDQDTQFSDVTVGPDGRTYISWAEIQGELEQTAQTFVIKLRVAPAGSTTFGPTRIVHRETLAIPFGGKLHADGFRIATYPKSTVAMVGGRPRVLVTWEACRIRLLDTICEEPQIKLTWSDNQGASWSKIAMVSAGGDNYFPTIADSPVGTRVALAYFTNRFDRVFHNRQDIEMVTIDATTGAAMHRQRLTPFSNEPEADPIFNNGRFIGDYIEVASMGGDALVHFNANYVSVPFLTMGFPVPQQDNFLTKARL
jgi:hypothetical protein